MFYASMIYGIHRHVHILSHETASSNICLFLGNLRNQIGTKEDYITSHGSMSSEWATSPINIRESIEVKTSIFEQMKSEVLSALNTSNNGFKLLHVLEQIRNLYKKIPYFRREIIRLVDYFQFCQEFYNSISIFLCFQYRHPKFQS